MVWFIVFVSVSPTSFPLMRFQGLRKVDGEIAQAAFQKLPHLHPLTLGFDISKALPQPSSRNGSASPKRVPATASSPQGRGPEPAPTLARKSVHFEGRSRLVEKVFRKDGLFQAP